MPGDLFTGPGIISLSLLSLATDLTDVTLGASGLWLGTRTGAVGTATLATILEQFQVFSSDSLEHGYLKYGGHKRINIISHSLMKQSPRLLGMYCLVYQTSRFHVRQYLSMQCTILRNTREIEQIVLNIVRCTNSYNPGCARIPV
jgi:hypothetical protein